MEATRFFTFFVGKKEVRAETRRKPSFFGQTFFWITSSEIRLKAARLGKLSDNTLYIHKG